MRYNQEIPDCSKTKDDSQFVTSPYIKYKIHRTRCMTAQLHPVKGTVN